MLAKKLALSTEKKVLMINTNNKAFTLTENKNLSYFDFKGNSLKKEIQNSATIFDDIVVNCSSEKNLSSALEVADQLIIPCDARTPTVAIWRLTRFEKIMEKALRKNPCLQGFYLMENVNNSSKPLMNNLARNQHFSSFTLEKEKQLFEVQ